MAEVFEEWPTMTWGQRLKRYAPGFIACVILAWVWLSADSVLSDMTKEETKAAIKAGWDKTLAGKSPWVGPAAFATRLLHANYIVLALVLGIIIRNLGLWPKALIPGLAFGRPLIKPGIVLLGVYAVFGNFVKMGPLVLFTILIFLIFTAFFILGLGKIINAPEKPNMLVAVGIGISGVSAVVAAAPSVRARVSDMTYAIVVLLLWGLIGLFLIPWTGKALAMDDYSLGALSALSIHNTAQILAAAFTYSTPAGVQANNINIVRVGCIPVMVAIIAFYYAALEARRTGLKEKVPYMKIFKETFPVFILGFFIISILASVGAFTKAETGLMRTWFKYFFAVGLTGIGLSTTFAGLREIGIRPLLTGFGNSIARWIVAIPYVIYIFTGVKVG